MSKIELINVTKIYGEPKRKGALPEGKKAIDDVSMVIPDQSFTVLVGPSGCGKTTLAVKKLIRNQKHYFS